MLSESVFHLKQVSSYFVSLGARRDLENQQLSHQSNKRGTFERRITHRKKNVS